MISPGPFREIRGNENGLNPMDRKPLARGTFFLYFLLI